MSNMCIFTVMDLSGIVAANETRLNIVPIRQNSVPMLENPASYRSAKQTSIKDSVLADKCRRYLK